jgi:hypothetical protein
LPARRADDIPDKKYAHEKKVLRSQQKWSGLLGRGD